MLFYESMVINHCVRLAVQLMPLRAITIASGSRERQPTSALVIGQELRCLHRAQRPTAYACRLRPALDSSLVVLGPAVWTNPRRWVSGTVHLQRTPDPQAGGHTSAIDAYRAIRIIRSIRINIPSAKTVVPVGSGPTSCSWSCKLKFTILA